MTKQPTPYEVFAGIEPSIRAYIARKYSFVWDLDLDDLMQEIAIHISTISFPVQWKTGEVTDSTLKAYVKTCARSYMLRYVDKCLANPVIALAGVYRHAEATTGTPPVQEASQVLREIRAFAEKRFSGTKLEAARILLGARQLPVDPNRRRKNDGNETYDYDALLEAGITNYEMRVVKRIIAEEFE